MLSKMHRANVIEGALVKSMRGSGLFRKVQLVKVSGIARYKSGEFEPIVLPTIATQKKVLGLSPEHVVWTTLAPVLAQKWQYEKVTPP
jgi:hypothetical protein